MGTGVGVMGTGVGEGVGEGRLRVRMRRMIMTTTTATMANTFRISICSKKGELSLNFLLGRGSRGRKASGRGGVRKEVRGVVLLELYPVPLSQYI